MIAKYGLISRIERYFFIFKLNSLPIFEFIPKRMISVKIDVEGIFGPALTNC
jgi:hypothetical protein